MKFINSSLTYFLAAIFCIILATGCLDSNQSQSTSSVQFGLQVDNFDSTLVSGNESISVDRVRFVFGDGSVGIDDTTATVFEEEKDWQQYNVTQPDNPQASGNPILLFRGSGGTYSSLTFSVQKAPEGNSNIDSDFTGEKRYTMIIDGTYNDSGFTFKSERDFQTVLPISPSVVVPQYDASYIFLVSTDVQYWFSNPSGGFYDPRVDENSSAINDRIENSFTIETQGSTNGQ